ncbi:MAG: hypothetical protein ABIC82_02585 [bacterium]
MKYLPLLAILTIITGCSMQNNSIFSVEEITQCISENTVEICKIRCNSDTPCEQRVDVIAKEKLNNPPFRKGGLGGFEEQNQSQEEIEKSDVESKNEIAEQSAQEKIEEQMQPSGLVTLSGTSCGNKENSPETMKIFAERVDVKKWGWIIPHGGKWELTDLEPGQYKIYYAPDRNAKPLAKYSEFIADGNGSHDYKILNLTNGGEVRNINPCDWE